MTYYAHSKNAFGVRHRLADHLDAVSRLAEGFAKATCFSEEAGLAGLLHDLGKYGDKFQARLRGEEQGLDHWSQGAWLALTEHKAIAAALAIQGHHIGLQHLNCQALRGLGLKRLEENHPLQLRLSEAKLEALKDRLGADDLKVETPLRTALGNDLDSRLDRMLDVRMLFSALVDADFLDTEAHFNGTETGKQYRQPGPELQPGQALAVLLAHIEKNLEKNTRAERKVASVRRALREACLRAAEQETGLFTLTAPTGSGKTLAMLAFALAHAKKHSLQRVVMVIPYLSIIEQTAAIYRDIFKSPFSEEYMLEHHSLAGGGQESCISDAEGKAGKGESTERRRQLLAENWDAPLIVTTSVQMLESLFSNRPSNCRKLHRLAHSVILLSPIGRVKTPAFRRQL
jgi:CRISPR-associated endonuclease/helicase Cas3